MPRGVPSESVRCKKCKVVKYTLHKSGLCAAHRVLPSGKRRGNKPIPGVCSECSKPFDSQTELKHHKYKDHGIHWGKNRGVVQYERKRWDAAEVKLLKSPNGRRMSAKRVAEIVDRSIAAVLLKRKRLGLK
jgi:hypothetical protein